MTSHRRLRRIRMRSIMGTFALACLVVAAILARPAPAAAHPLGNFTINRYSRLEFSTDSIRLTYVLDFAEIPTFQEMQRLDSDGDGAMSDAEANAYLAATMPELVKGLRLVVGGEVLPLTVVDRSAAFMEGQGGLPLLRIDANLSAMLPTDWTSNGTGGYLDRNFSDRLGWREIVIRGGPGVVIQESSAPDIDISNELRSYPTDALSSPLNMSEATFTLAPGEGTLPSGTAAQSAETIASDDDGGRATDRVAALVTVEELTPTVIFVSILIALFWGAVHALTPGHGKAIVAAYLIGARGTARHAAFLGLTVTLTHTAGVFALGLVTLYLSRFILPETLYPWLGVASGALVIIMGVTLAISRLRSRPSAIVPATDAGHGHDHYDDEHSHPADAHVHTHGGHAHSHLPPGMDGGAISWRSLLALGVSGGLIPCPSALILLLGAIALGRLEFGIVLVLAFSVGLAVVLTGVGLLLVYARRLFQMFSLELRVPRMLPIASSLIITIAGFALVLSSLEKTDVI